MNIQSLPPNFDRPHVVILGAGASRAACLNGDKRCNKLPLMNDLVDVLQLGPLLKKYGTCIAGKDFETIYSDLSSSGENSEFLDALEHAVFDYFNKLALLDHPTLYDHLVLSLRKKDLIITFNWDPLLPQALHRVGKRFGYDMLPTVLYLHGNVTIGYCHHHEPATLGVSGYCCGKCGEMLVPSRLLYPVKEKNYNDPSIALSWNEVQRFLKDAYLLTIFGYGAPKSDVKAIELMKSAWGAADSRQQEEIEIIDIRSRDELHKIWAPFICRNHWSVSDDFYTSFASLYPRRSCENFRETHMQNNPQYPMPIQSGASWGDLESFFKPLIEQERHHNKGHK